MAQTVETMIEDLVGPLVDVSDLSSPETCDSVTEWASDVAREVINALPTEMLWSVGEDISDSSGGTGANIDITYTENPADSDLYKITAVAVASNGGGSGYESDPEIKVLSPTGDHAEIRGFSDGSALIAVDLVSSGSGYKGNETETITGQNGATVTTAKFLHAHKNGYKALEIAAADKARSIDSASMYFATAKSPAFYRENGKIHIKPGGGTVVVVKYPTINYNDATVTGVPDDVKHLVIMGAAVKGRLFQLDALRRSLDNIDEPSYNTANASLVLVPVPSITDLTLVSAPDDLIPPSFSEGLIASSTVTFEESAPVFNKPIFSPPSLENITPLSMDSLSGDLPDASALLIQDYSVGALPTSLPAYTKSDAPVPVYDIAQFETFLETEEDSELADSQMKRLNHEVQSYQADLQKYSNKIQEELNEFNKENVQYQSELQKVILDAQSKQPEDAAKMQKLQGELSRYSALVNNKIQEYQNNEIQHKFQKWSTEYANGLQEYNVNLQAESQKFNEANNEYQAKLQIAMRDAEAASREYLQEGNNKLQSEVQEYTNKLQAHGAKLQKYSAEVNSQLQEYGVNEIQKEIGLWQAENTQKLQKYGADLQKEAARHGSEMQKYQIDIQNIFQKHQTMTQELQVLDAQYTRGLQTFIASYKEPIQNAKGA